MLVSQVLQYFCRFVPGGYDNSGVRNGHLCIRRRIGHRTQVQCHVTRITPAITIDMNNVTHPFPASIRLTNDNDNDDDDDDDDI